MQQDEIENQVKQKLVLTYLRQAIGETSDVPWRMATRLFDTGLITDIEVTDPVFDQIVSVLSKDDKFLLDHSSPLYIFSKNQCVKIPFEYIELTDLLGWRNIEIAKLIAPAIERTINKHISSNMIKQLINNYIGFLDNNDLKNVLCTAAKLDEALVDNWEWKILLLKQASDDKIEALVKRQIPRLLNVDPIEINMFSYLQDQFSKVISIISPADAGSTSNTNTSEQDRIRQLGPVVGHLPWDSNIGFGSVLDNKNNTTDQSLDLWPAMECWLDYDKPAWWFHVWFSAVTHPHNVPITAWPNIWKKIEILLGNTIEGYEKEVTNAQRYLALLRYYIYRLEVSLPSENTDYIFWSASKLASDVLSSCVVNNAELDNVIGHAVDDARLVWQVATPVFSNTSIRSTFIKFDNYWISAVQSSVANWDIQKSKENIPQTTLEYLEGLIKWMSLNLNNLDNRDSDSTSSLLIANLSNLRDEWKSIFPSEETHSYIDAHLELINKYSDAEAIMQKVSSPLVEKDVDGIVALSRLNGFLRDGRITTARLFDLISSKKWRETVEPSMQVEYIYHIIEALLGGQWLGSDNLHVDLPHWAVRQCLDNIGDEERCKAYFVAIVLFSIKGNTSSAISRIMFEDKANVLSKNIAIMQDTLKRVLNISPSWLSGRLRAILATLSK